MTPPPDVRERAREVARRPGVLAMGERALSNEWTGLLAFALLIGALHLTLWQGILATIVFVQRTTKRPAWLLREQAHRRILEADNPAHP